MEPQVQPKVIKAIIEMRERGASQKTIAEEMQATFGVKINQGNVSKILIGAGLRTNKKKIKRGKRVKVKTARPSSVSARAESVVSMEFVKKVCENNTLTVDQKFDLLTLTMKLNQ